MLTSLHFKGGSFSIYNYFTSQLTGIKNDQLQVKQIYLDKMVDVAVSFGAGNNRSRIIDELSEVVKLEIDIMGLYPYEPEKFEALSPYDTGIQKSIFKLYNYNFSYFFVFSLDGIFY